MKKLLAVTVLALSLTAAGCAGADAPKSVSDQNQPNATQSTQASASKAEQNTAQAFKLSMQVAGKSVTIALADNAATQRLIAQLPADLTFKDFNNTEKITYLPNKINVDGAPEGHAPKAGDMCIYVPWGNICIFYHDYKFSSDLVYLGHVEQGLDTLSAQSNDFQVNLSAGK